MRQKTINIYKFKELPEDIQEKAIENNRFSEVEYHEWWDFEYDYIAEKAQYELIDNASVKGFSLDRDYCINILCDFDIKAFIDSKMPEKINTATSEFIENEFNVKTYTIRNESYLDFDYPKYKGKIGRLFNALEEIIQETYDSFKHEALKTLQDQYDYLISDEAIKESLLSNEAEFTDNGEIYRYDHKPELKKS